MEPAVQRGFLRRCCLSWKGEEEEETLREDNLSQGSFLGIRADRDVLRESGATVRC
jgi:hypothetical protein